MDPPALHSCSGPYTSPGHTIQAYVVGVIHVGAVWDHNSILVSGQQNPRAGFSPHYKDNTLHQTWQVGKKEMGSRRESTDRHGHCLQTDTATVYRQMWTLSILPSFQQGKQGEGNREGTATLLKSEWASLRPEHQIPRPPEIQTSSHLCCFYTHKSGTALVETA